MIPEMRVAYINAQVASALCELAAYQAANKVAEIAGQTPPYAPSDFLNIPNGFGIHHNAVIGYFTGR